MAMSVGRKDGPVADINVTPMADVIIVLLIIFMVAVPLMTDDRTVALPRAVNSAGEGLLYERVARVLELCRQSGAESVELMTAPRRQ